MSYCLFGRDVSVPTIIESFMKYLSPSEEELVHDYMTRASFPDIEDQDDFLDFLGRIKCRAAVNIENITKIMTELCQQQLIQKIHFLVATWQPVLEALNFLL